MWWIDDALCKLSLMTKSTVTFGHQPEFLSRFSLVKEKSILNLYQIYIISMIRKMPRNIEICRRNPKFQ